MAIRRETRAFLLLVCASCSPSAPDVRAPAPPKEVVTVYVTAPCPSVAAPPTCWPLRPELRGPALDAAGSPVTEAGRAKNELTCDEVRGIKKLTLQTVDSLDGLELFTGLERLSVKGVRDRSLAPLSRLNHLQSIQIGPEQWELSTNVSNPIPDLSPLAALPGLTELILRNAQLNSLAPLASLTPLQKLDLQQSHIADIAPLATLKNLRELNLNFNEVRSLEPLRGLTSLELLNLGSNQISDVAPLANLKHLRELDLSHNPVEDISAFGGLQSLEELMMTMTKIRDVASLEPLPKLRTLYICLTPALDSPGTGAAAVRKLIQRGVAVPRGMGCHG